MNKISKFFLAVAAISMTACSSDEPTTPTNPVNPDEAAFSDNYLSVSLMMPTAMGGRADDDPAYKDQNDYTDGTETESKVNNVFFFFFDSKNNVIDIQKFENIDFKDENPFNPNPFVTSFGTQEVRLKSGLEYRAVAVAINSSVASAADFRNIKTLSDLEDHGHQYLSDIKTAGFVMSNSVYYDKLDAEGRSTYTTATTPQESDKIILVPITEKNIYTSAQRGTIDNLIKDGTKAYVDIFVERVLAKVEVTSSLNIDEYYVSSDDDGKNKTQTITLYDNVNLTTRTVKVTPVILGASLNVLTKEAKLIKPILANQVGYSIGTAAGYKFFQWNDPVNKRSYWANTPEVSQDNMTYVSWNAVKGQNMKNSKVDFTEYIHPNTQDFLPTAENENNSSNTKVMVVAQLQAKYVDEDGNEVGDAFNLDLVRYGSEYMEKSGFLAHVANYVAVAMRSESWAEADGFTATEKAILDVLVPNSLADKTITNGDKTETQRVLTSDMFEIGKLSTDMNGAYEAVVSKSGKFTYTFTIDAKKDAYFFKYSQEEIDAMTEAQKEAAAAQNFFKEKAIADVFNAEDAAKTLEALAYRANTQLTAVVDRSLSEEEINKPQILYWNDGMTYFYTTIKQQGFYGLTGAEDEFAPNYLNGVVRNHVYKVNLTGFYGLGTPVIDPTTPIDPERPTIERPSYLKARINVLPWRIVVNNATIH